MATASRTENVNVRIEPEKRRLLETAARLKGCTISDIARPHVEEAVREARRIISEHTTEESDDDG